MADGTNCASCHEWNDMDDLELIEPIGFLCDSCRESKEKEGNMTLVNELKELAEKQDYRAIDAKICISQGNEIIPFSDPEFSMYKDNNGFLHGTPEYTTDWGDGGPLLDKLHEQGFQLPEASDNPLLVEVCIAWLLLQAADAATA